MYGTVVLEFHKSNRKKIINSAIKKSYFVVCGECGGVFVDVFLCFCDCVFVVVWLCFCVFGLCGCVVVVVSVCFVFKYNLTKSILKSYISSK